MNGAIEQQLNSSQRVVTNTTDKWEDLSKVYLVAMSCHIPRYSVKPSRPWISESTLQLLARRGRFRTEGDMAQVAEFNREIRKAARRDKRAWLDEQLQTGGLECHHQSQKALPSAGPHLETHSRRGSGYSYKCGHLCSSLSREAVEGGWQAANLSTAPVLTAPPTISETTISMEELKLAIKQLKVGKRCGKDRIPNELFKALQGKGLDALLELFRDCFATQSSPAQWREAQGVAILKKSAADDPGNYGPISLLQTCYKLNARIIANRLSDGLDEHIRELQYGFRRGRSTSEAISLVRRLQDLVDTKQHQRLYLMFLDWNQAFDSIRPSALHGALARMGVLSHTCGVIREFVSKPMFEVIMGEHTSQRKQQQSGIRQGCTLSPLLFILLQTVQFHDVRSKYKSKHPLATTPQLPFFDIEFADDTVLVARTQEQMQGLLLLVQQEAEKYDLHLNLNKTKLVLYNSDASVIFSNGDPVPKVSSIVYLGDLIETNMVSQDTRFGDALDKLERFSRS